MPEQLSVPLISTMSTAWVSGSPVDGRLRWLARACVLLVIVLISVWVFKYLGGVALSPTPTGPGENDTGVIFNWHPLLMAFAFPLFMGEAILAYRAPLIGGDQMPKNQKKLLHGCLHGASALLVVLGAVAAFKSHSMKLPSPIPDLYSVHSWMGITTLLFVAIQVTIAIGAYVWPGWSPDGRKGLGPTHIFFGLATFIAGLCTMATGLQEKATFLQVLGKADVRSPVMVLPAVTVVVLALAGLLIVAHHMPAKPVMDSLASSADTEGDRRA